MSSAMALKAQRWDVELVCKKFGWITVCLTLEYCTGFGSMPCNSGPSI